MDFGFLFDNFVELTITGLAFGAIYALIALGYTLVYGVLQLINFAHSEVFMYGTFAVIWVCYFFNVDESSSTTTVIAVMGVALLAAMAMSALIALIVERTAYRPLLKRNAPRLVALISAIGASFVLAEAMGLRDQAAAFVGLDDELRRYVTRARDTVGMPDIIEYRGVVDVFGYTVSNIDLLLITSALVMMMLLDQFIRRSRLGRGIRAVAQDPEAAALMGVNSVRTIQITFLIGGLMAGVAAVLYMLKVGSTGFSAGFLMGIKAFTAAVLGGIGNLRGALLGGLVLGVSENWGAAVFGSQWRDVVAFVLLVVILLFRPTGLLGEALGKVRT